MACAQAARRPASIQMASRVARYQPKPKSVIRL